MEVIIIHTFWDIDYTKQELDLARVKFDLVHKLDLSKGGGIEVRPTTKSDCLRLGSYLMRTSISFSYYRLRRDT